MQRSESKGLSDAVPSSPTLEAGRDPGGRGRTARARDESPDRPARPRRGERSRSTGPTRPRGDLHLPLRRAGAARQLRPQARRARGDSRRVQADRHPHTRDPDLRAPADAGEPEPALVAGPVADASLERPLGRPSDHAHRADAAPSRVRPHQAVADRLALDRRRRRSRDEAEEQPAARGRSSPRSSSTTQAESSRASSRG